MKLNLPGGKKFIFTIIDDTDDAFTDSIKPVYDVLIQNGLKTTKTVWVYPVRDHDRSKGDCLECPLYREFVKYIQTKGFEIALHNVGSGNYSRNEIIDGLERYKKILGDYPSIHVNHSYNPDNIYCGPERFSFPFNLIVKNLYSNYKNFFGHVEGSEHFWGDLHKKYIKYSRNYEIDNINTIKKCPLMPYSDRSYNKYANYWYASTFAPNPWVFNKVINRKSVDKLEDDQGICILYTHLGYYYKKGKVDEGFENMIKYISAKDTGLFIPVSDVLDLLYNQKKDKDKFNEITRFEKFRLEASSLYTRIKYRYINRIDDFHFKKSKQYNES